MPHDEAPIESPQDGVQRASRLGNMSRCGEGGALERTGSQPPIPPLHGSVWQSLSLSLQELWTWLWVSEALAGLSQAKDRRAQSRDPHHSKCLWELQPQG